MLNSLKTEQDILAYPPKLVFTPTLAAYRDVLFGSGSILPNLWSSFVISVGTTILTMVLAIPAAYALARLRVPGKRFAGFYILASQMLPPVGIIIPYFLILRNCRLARHLSGHHPDLPVLLAALRDLAAGLLFRGHPLRDGGGGVRSTARAGCGRSGASSSRRCRAASR